MFGLLFSVIQIWADDVPSLSRRVTDLTGTLSVGEQRQLEDTLSRFEEETSNQLVVLIIPALDGESIEDYSLRVAEKNKIGTKEHRNGVLLLIAKDDRKMRIEVGYGLEGALPDAISDQIIRRIIVPEFRDGDYTGGIEAGVNAIISATKGEYKGEGRRNGNGKFPFTALVFAGIFVVAFLSRLLGGGRRHYVGSRGYYSRGGWWMGGGGFGGGGFGGGGGGGFSGGGGSFGGGGASGSW